MRVRPATRLKTLIFIPSPKLRVFWTTLSLQNETPGCDVLVSVNATGCINNERRPEAFWRSNITAHETDPDHWGWNAHVIFSDFFLV